MRSGNRRRQEILNFKGMDRSRSDLENWAHSHVSNHWHLIQKIRYKGGEELKSQTGKGEAAQRWQGPSLEAGARGCSADGRNHRRRPNSRTRASELLEKSPRAAEGASQTSEFLRFSHPSVSTNVPHWLTPTRSQLARESGKCSFQGKDRKWGRQVTRAMFLFA